MKIETYVNALCLSKGRPEVRRFRQFNKFYDRIIQMDAEKDARIKEMQDIYTLERILNEDPRIAELEKEVQFYRSVATELAAEEDFINNRKDL